IFFLSLPSFELKTALSFSRRQVPRITASHVYDTTCWLACADGSVRSYKIQLGTYTMMEGVNLSLHPNKICMIASAPHTSNHEISRRMVSIGEDVMLCWNPDSQELVEQPLRFRSLAPISYAIVLSGTSIISASRKMGKVVLWKRPSNFCLDDSDSC